MRTRERTVSFAGNFARSSLSCFDYFPLPEGGFNSAIFQSPEIQFSPCRRCGRSSTALAPYRGITSQFLAQTLGAGPAIQMLRGMSEGKTQ